MGYRVIARSEATTESRSHTLGSPLCSSEEHLFVPSVEF